MNFFERETARALFLLSKVLERLGDSINSKAQLEEANQLREKIDRERLVKEEDLKDEDFDKLLIREKEKKGKVPMALFTHNTGHTRAYFHTSATSSVIQLLARWALAMLGKFPEMRK
ncbi:hypothetical protein PG997_010974 [Apiospora hydei]|uniref:Uncharacterized protein n=1 Tax=Apiospora hydei TaxID=1337664 RepID=A0ABR1VHR0_9PEZI